MYYCFMDFDGTLTINNKNLNNEAIDIINKYLIHNELCIITEESYEVVKKYLKDNNINCDIASIGSNTLLFHNQEITSFIPLNKIIQIINLCEGNIYTSYLESSNKTEIINYQERLDSIYPKLNRQIINTPSDKANSIFLAVNIAIKDKLINLLKDLELSYKILGDDKNRIILRITSIFNDKIDIYYYLEDYLKDKKIIGISDSSSDIPILDKCDIKLAMKNGDALIKAKYQITQYDVFNNGALIELKDICKL